jgi:hypothetical protein
MSPRALPHRMANEHLLPATFEERGAMVPFTTPILAHARIRRDWRQRLELVIPGFAGGAGDYVIPWRAAGEVLSLTTHDTQLHAEVTTHQALEPRAVRRVALEVATGGLAGPDVAEAASRALAEDAEATEINELVLILRVIAEVEPDHARQLMQEVRSPEGQARVRETLSAVADRLALDTAAFDPRVAELGALTCAVGAPDSPAPGRIRVILGRLQEFGETMASWGAERLGVVAEQASFCAKAVAQTSRVTNALLSTFDGAIASPHQVVGDWRAKSAAIEQLTARLAWLVDGWEMPIETWFAAGGESEQIGALAEIVPILPLLPRAEAQLSHELAELGRLAGVGRRWVRTVEDWRTGEPDIEMIYRLEALKARTI